MKAKMMNPLIISGIIIVDIYLVTGSVPLAQVGLPLSRIGLGGWVLVGDFATQLMARVDVSLV